MKTFCIFTLLKFNAGGDLLSGSNVTFVLVQNNLAWSEAQTYCREHHTDLSSVRNLSENEKVKQLIPTGESAWIGLRSSWKWSDGSKSSFRYWSNKEPNGGELEDCAAVDFGISGYWQDWPCAQRFPFICFRGKPSYCKSSVWACCLTL